MSRPLLGLALALALGACQAAPDRSPCADVDCSGHGSCQLASPAGGGASVPTCSCDTGYAPTPSGMLCTPVTDTSLCAGIDCSGHGSCVSIKGTAQCACDTGYQLGSTGLSCADPCSGITCSGHGSCKQTSGAAVCTCDAGYRTALGDKTTCEPGDGLNVLVYDVLYGTSYKLGRVQLDRTNQSQGKLVEQHGYGTHASQYKARTEYTLDASEEEVTALEAETLYSLYKVANRRWTKAVLDGKGSVTTQLQRLDKVATFSSSYQGPKRPIPMPGAYEYPDSSDGCISPLFSTSRSTTPKTVRSPGSRSRPDRAPPRPSRCWSSRTGRSRRPTTAAYPPPSRSGTSRWSRATA